MMIKKAIHKLLNKEDLSFDMTKSVMDEIMSGSATEAQIASFITAMRMKGETIDEITACATIMRKYGAKLKHDGDVLDIVGTGGIRHTHSTYPPFHPGDFSSRRASGKARQQECIQ